MSIANLLLDQQNYCLSDEALLAFEENMQKRNLGNTDIQLTSIGFGGAPLGNLFEELNEPECFNIVKKSYEMNINLFDTSPLYGYGLSEHRIGNFLKNIDPDKFENFYSKLIDTNTELWEIEDNIRIFEKEKNFGEEFIQLARDVYYTNDKRFDIKSQINLFFGSDVIEEKEYIEYE